MNSVNVIERDAVVAAKDLRKIRQFEKALATLDEAENEIGPTERILCSRHCCPVKLKERQLAWTSSCCNF